MGQTYQNSLAGSSQVAPLCLSQSSVRVFDSAVTPGIAGLERQGLSWVTPSNACRQEAWVHPMGLSKGHLNVFPTWLLTFLRMKAPGEL